MAVRDRVVSWQLTCSVTTGFIGKGPLAGYNELRRFTARAMVPAEDSTDRARHGQQ